MTDFELKHKAVKQVVVHMKRKVQGEYAGSDHLKTWLEEMDALLEQPDFVLSAYYDMRHKLNDVIESTLDDQVRVRLRDSWFSFGKALDKKVTPK